MSETEFAWDQTKNLKNLAKHGVDFVEAMSVFFDERAKLIFDPDHSVDEDRYVLLGISTRLRILVVCHCYRSNTQIIRIISARRATAAERKQYKSGIDAR